MKGRVQLTSKLSRHVQPPHGDVGSGHGYHGVPTKGRAYDSYGNTYPIGQGEAAKNYQGKVMASGSHVIHPRHYSAKKAYNDYRKGS